MRDNGAVTNSLAQSVFAAAVQESDAAFCLRQSFEDEEDRERRAAIRQRITPRTREAHTLATAFGCTDAWQWILEHALVRRKVRPSWSPLRSQHEVLRAMRSVRTSVRDRKQWRALVEEARTREEPGL